MQPTSFPRLLLLTVTGLCLQPALPAAATKKPEAGGPGAAKPYVLFMGADLAVLRDRQYYQVTDVTGSEFKIQIGQREFFVPTRRQATGIKVNNSLKLTGRLVQLDGLEAGPGYTPANDPKLKFARESGAAGGAAAVQDLAYGAMIRDSMNSGMLSAVADANATGPGAAASRAAADTAASQLVDSMRQFETTNSMSSSSQYNTGMQANRMMQELDEANYDAIEVSFRISSPVELDDPYMVVLFKFLEREAKPGQEGMLIHAKSLDPIGPDRKYIRIREGGMPKGFTYVDCEVHIFNRGEEVATNLSPKRVELTRGEAKEYLVIEHLSTNKGATVPAVAVPGTLPRGRRQALSLDQLNRLCYAKIADDGSLLGVYLDEGCQQPLEDAGTQAAFGDVFFKPALEKGKPVGGVVRCTLGAI
jgi:hypothetical protein